MYLRNKEDLKVGDKLQEKESKRVYEIIESEGRLAIGDINCNISLDLIKLDNFEYVETEEEIRIRKEKQEAGKKEAAEYANKYLNAENVLEMVEQYIEDLKLTTYNRKVLIRNVCKELSIFDWWNDYLSISQLEDMKKFLKEAIKLGFTGYVCFKVGAAGCSNGMWAHKNKSTDGYSPKGASLYKSFISTYNYWSIELDDETRIPDRKEYDSIKTIKQLEEVMKNINI